MANIIGKTVNCHILENLLYAQSPGIRKQVFKRVSFYNRRIRELIKSFDEKGVSADTVIRLLEDNMHMEVMNVRSDHRLSEEIQERLVGYFRYKVRDELKKFYVYRKEEKNEQKRISRIIAIVDALFSDYDSSEFFADSPCDIGC